jgi:hypothetical protein
MSIEAIAAPAAPTLVVPRYLRLPAIFAACLVIATVVPFFAGALSGQYKGSYVPLQWTITLLATIHVPMTLYLLFDARVRERMYQQPLLLIGVPILLIGISLFAFSYLGALMPEGRNWPLVYLLCAMTVWQTWHFGKQNLGVYSFMRIAQSAGSMAKIDRHMIIGGATLGAISGVLSMSIYTSYAPQSDLGFLSAHNDVIFMIGSWLQYALAAASVVYVVLRYRKFTLGTGLIFLLSVNFFLPTYLTGDARAFSNVFACSALGHGTQYCVFLAFHAGGHDSGEIGPRRWVMPVILILVTALTSELFILHWIVPEFWVGSVIARLIGYGSGGSLWLGLVIGVTLVHFWLDSFLWRFKDSTARTWMMQRYAFLFPIKRNVQ